MQADATVAPKCIDIIYILHVYLSLCVIAIYCKCVSTNKYCLLSIVKKIRKSSQKPIHLTVIYYLKTCCKGLSYLIIKK